MRRKREIKKLTRTMGRLAKEKMIGMERQILL